MGASRRSIVDRQRECVALNLRWSWRTSILVQPSPSLLRRPSQWAQWEGDVRYFFAGGRAVILRFLLAFNMNTLAHVGQADMGRLGSEFLRIRLKVSARHHTTPDQPTQQRRRSSVWGKSGDITGSRGTMKPPVWPKRKKRPARRDSAARALTG